VTTAAHSRSRHSRSSLPQLLATFSIESSIA
jgi:hypothetical protein